MHPLLRLPIVRQIILLLVFLLWVAIGLKEKLKGKNEKKPVEQSSRIRGITKANQKILIDQPIRILMPGWI